MSSFARWHHQGAATWSTFVSSALWGGSAGSLTYFYGWSWCPQLSRWGRTSLQFWLPREDPWGWQQCDNSLTKQFYFTKLQKLPLLWPANFPGKRNTKSICKCGHFTVPSSTEEKVGMGDFQNDPTQTPNLFINTDLETRKTQWQSFLWVLHGFCYGTHPIY